VKHSNRTLHDEVVALQEDGGIECLINLLTPIQFEGLHLKPNDLKGLLDELVYKEKAGGFNPTVRLSPYREKLTGTKVNQTEYIRRLTRRYK